MKAEEKALRKIREILGDYITNGGAGKSKRKLQVLKLNFGRNLSGLEKQRVLKKIEKSKELI